MLSPMSYDGAPTPPPQPSPGAFNSSTLDRSGYQGYQGNRYPASPREQQMLGRMEDNRFTSPRNEHVSPQHFNGVQSQRQFDQSASSRLLNGSTSSQHNLNNDFSIRSRQQQPIRKDNPPSLNITAKSVSSPNINVNSNNRYGKTNKQDEELAIAR